MLPPDARGGSEGLGYNTSPSSAASIKACTRWNGYYIQQIDV